MSLDNNELSYLIISLFGLILLINVKNKYNKETMINIDPIPNKITWTKNKQCRYQTIKTIQNIIDKNNFIKDTDNNWNIYMPCTYNDINKEIKHIFPTNIHQRIFIIHNADQVSGKNTLWSNIKKKYGKYASIFMPNTYILADKDDMIKFYKEYDKNKIYILKKNIQRQEGLLITNKLSDITNSRNKGFVVVQELLQNPYLIDQRKINMRIYLLIVCKNNEIDAYAHTNGFMYYTKVPFIKNSLEKDPNITTGYIDREVYEKNPLTLKDFRLYLDNINSRQLNSVEYTLINNNKSISTTVFNRIYRLLTFTIYAIKSNICTMDKLKNNITFQLFGVDVALNDNLYPQIIEINKGPDLGAKDKRDSEVKHKVVSDMFKVIRLIKDEDNEFIYLNDKIDL